MKIIGTQSKGFTLIEAMIVISVIGILAVMVVVSMGLSRQRSLTSRVKADLLQTDKAIALLRADTGKWPGGCEPETISAPILSLNNFQAGLIRRPEIGDQGNGCKWTQEEIANWQGPYIDRLQDPWGHDYYLDADYTPYQNCEGIIEQPSVPVILSFGPNGIGPNIYDCDDIFLKVD